MAKNENRDIVKNVLILVLAVAVLVLIILLLFKGCFNQDGVTTTDQPSSITTNQPSDVTSGEFIPDIDDNAGEYTGSSIPDKGGAAKGIKIPGYPKIEMPANQKDVRVSFMNPEGNPCYFTFELVLTDTGESLYKSKMVPPGKVIEQITLARPLAAGEYDATIKITTNDLSTGAPMNGANVVTVLSIR